MSFAGMVAQLLRAPVELAAWTGPVLVRQVGGPDRKKDAAPAVHPKAPKRPKTQRKPRKAARAQQQVAVIPAPA